MYKNDSIDLNWPIILLLAITAAFGGVSWLANVFLVLFILLMTFVLLMIFVSSDVTITTDEKNQNLSTALIFVAMFLNGPNMLLFFAAIVVFLLMQVIGNFYKDKV